MPKILLTALFAIAILTGCSGKAVKRTATLPFHVTAAAVKGAHKIVKPPVGCAVKATGAVLKVADKAVESKTCRVAADYAATASY